MKWKYETDDQKIERKSKWHKFFAWIPIGIDGNRYWLQTVERKGKPYYNSRGVSFVYEYREALIGFESIMDSEAISVQCTSEPPSQ